MAVRFKNPFTTGGAAVGKVYSVDSDGYIEWITVGSGGVATVTSLGSSPNAAAASISGTVLTLQPADASFPGAITAGTQSLAGFKTLQGRLDIAAPAVVSTPETLQRWTVADDAEAYVELVNQSSTDARFDPLLKCRSADSTTSRALRLRGVIKTGNDGGSAPVIGLEVERADGTAVASRPALTVTNASAGTLITLQYDGDLETGNIETGTNKYISIGGIGVAAKPLHIHNTTAGQDGLVKLRSTSTTGLADIQFFDSADAVRFKSGFGNSGTASPFTSSGYLWTASGTDLKLVSHNALVVTHSATGVDVLAPAVVGQETVQRWRVSDDATAFLAVNNNTSSAGSFIPQLLGQAPNSASLTGLSLVGQILAANDSGTVSAALTFQARRDTAAAVTARPTFSWSNFGTTQMAISADGNLGIGNTLTPGKPLDILCATAGQNGLIRARATSTTAFNEISFLDTAGTLRCSTGFGNSGVGSPYTSSGYVFTNAGTDYKVVAHGALHSTFGSAGLTVVGTVTAAAAVADSLTRTSTSGALTLTASRANTGTPLAFNFNNGTTLTSGNLALWENNGTDVLTVSFNGALGQRYTSSAGTPGNATIDKPLGRVALAAGASAVTVTNATATAGCVVFVQAETADANLGTLVVTYPGAGSFVVTNYVAGVATNLAGAVTLSFEVLQTFA